MKMQGKVARTATMALPALACKWFLDTENEWFHDDPYDTDDPSMSWALEEPEPSPVDMSTRTNIFCGGSEAAAGKPAGLELIAFPKLEQLSAATEEGLRADGFGYR